MTIEDQIRATAARHGVPGDLAVSVAMRESSLNPDARGAKGEVGLFQLMPGTAAYLGVNAYDIGQNIEGGVRYLKEQYGRFGNWTDALVAYNAGPGKVIKGTAPAVSYRYAEDILDKAGDLFEAGAHWVVDVIERPWFPSFSLPGLPGAAAPANADKILIGAIVAGAVSLALLSRR